MQKFTTHQPAQIGVVAVLLTTVLLAVGVSVTTRVVDQVAQETARTESNQSFNVAESSVDTAAGGAGFVGDINTGNTGNTAAAGSINPDIASSVTGTDTIYLQVGDSVEIKFTAADPERELFWERGDSPCATDDTTNCPALLLSWYPNTPDYSVSYYPLTSAGARKTPNNNRAGYIDAEALPANERFRNRFVTGMEGADISGEGTLRIKALYSGTYISMAGLTTTTRAAAANAGGNEVRVAEQNQTRAAAPFVMDYALFAGSGSIGQQ